MTIVAIGYGRGLEGVPEECVWGLGEVVGVAVLGVLSLCVCSSLSLAVMISRVSC